MSGMEVAVEGFGLLGGEVSLEPEIGGGILGGRLGFGCSWHQGIGEGELILR